MHSKKCSIALNSPVLRQKEMAHIAKRILLHFTFHTSTLHTLHSPLHTSHFTLHTSHSPLHTSHSTFHTSHFHTSHLYCKAWAKYLPVRLCSANFALHKVLLSTALQGTSQYFVLQYYKAFTNTSQYYFVLQTLHKHFPVLLCTTELAQGTSQYHFVPQYLHKALPNTTLYYTVSTRNFPVLLCITNLAQSTSQYYFVLQNLHKALPSTNLYRSTCTK